MHFGEFFHELRIKKGFTLRRFAEILEEDPGNISRLERGKLQAPKSEEKLQFYAKALGLKKGSESYIKFMDLAHVSNKTFGIEHIRDEALLEKLPMFLRTLNNKGLDEKKLKP
ncbi:hypothetical protein NITGR_160003 [Nitrospina gracilis 3/211]|uniref:HTH cro/C1-type domain-containing protein n=1 Tax=Nitrospina gracilis (strain 3/211) TaxID=1266370 RepID=M1YW59_NITG3|nr:helix-turn-helix transcriptional regulator [Nitrospina gracilis]CCQ89694.1 hypothetical protein NITGR_160003 [Nitrospina gracilis 3/211]